VLHRYLLILVISLLSTQLSFSQNNITGIWEGRFLAYEIDLGVPKLVIEIYDFKDSIFRGVTHLYYQGNKYEHYKMTGWISKKDSLVLMKEEATIAVDLGKYSNCLGTYISRLKKMGNELYLVGYWTPNIRFCTSNSDTWVKKMIVDTVKALPPPKKEVPVTKAPTKNKPPVEKKIAKEKTPVIVTEAPVIKKIPPVIILPPAIPDKIAKRETDIQSLIEIAASEKDSIKVDVYDNGEIDGDSVSVYFDQLQLINRKMISTKPITFYVSLNKNKNPISHLRMVAESLGSIPPCTALMIVTTKSKRYEVRLSSNFNKNASVELFLKD
jgi:hypothetical protein